MRRILVLVSDLGAGGAERVVVSLASAWVQRGLEVHVVATFSSRPRQHYQLPGAVSFTRLADFPGCTGRNPTAYWRRLSRLRRLALHIEPDVIVSFLTNVNVLGLLATTGADIPVIVSERVDPSSERETSWLLRRLRWATYPMAAGIVVQTARAGVSLASMIAGSTHVEVIPNPLPPDFPSAPREVRRAAGRKCVVAAGRLTWQKRFDVLIDSFSLVAGRFQDWDLKIWGEGELLESLIEQVNRSGLQGRVRFHGRTDSLWARLLEADLFVSSSDFEGFPNAMLEAMALGVACVTTDCPSGPRELSQDGDLAHLVPPADPEAMAVALQALMSDAAARERLGQRASEIVRRDYALPVILDRWNHLIEAVLR